MPDLASPELQLWLPRIAVVKNALDYRLNRKTHQHFVAYLHLRQAASKTGRLSALDPNWGALGDYLAVGGGPPNKPYLRPFLPHARNANQEWLNKNLAGSFAPSSVRTAATAPLAQVVEIAEDGTYSLRENHAEIALTALLFGEPIEPSHLGLFYFRNRGIWLDRVPPIEALVICFRDEFGYRSPEDNDEYDILYSAQSPPVDELFDVAQDRERTSVQDQPIAGRLTTHALRSLTAADLGLSVERSQDELDDNDTDSLSPRQDELSAIPKSDEIYIRVLSLLSDYGGIIFVGPSGTSKSYYARRIALTLTGGDTERCRFVQFHPSYQYEDFVEGLRPKTDGSGFELIESHLLQLCRLAESTPQERHVLVIDELSRGDPGRIFGEALTYLERSKRGISFHLASGKKFRIPNNVVILATMNPLDHGAEQVDAAFDRRFAKIRMDPDRSKLDEFLTHAGMEEALKSRVLRFFDRVNGLGNQNPYVRIGHTYFVGASDASSLISIWEHQLSFNLAKAFPYDQDQIDAIRTWWQDVLGPSAKADQDVDQNETPDDSGV